ncbi:MAG: protein kinase [bacterium]|nr:protein kinase [bacterium]
MPPEPQQIGGYQLLDPVGQGGMATVYKAFHPRLNRYVAIKMIHAGYMEDAAFIARFEREAQIVAALEHPHIVPVYDCFEHRGMPCLVMKYIDGVTLKAALSGGALAIEDVIGLLPPIAAALDYAHGQGVLHRDIKPSNILLDKSASPFLTDFGLAKMAGVGETTISENMLIGTPFYMSPEQGNAGGMVTARSDLYSLGVVLYELIVGQLPYRDGTPYAIIHDHIYKPLPLPSVANPAVSADVEAVLLRALAKLPEDRYASAAEMIDSLIDAVSKSQPSLARHPKLERRTSKPESLPESLSHQEPVENRAKTRHPAKKRETSPASPTKPVKKRRMRRRWLIAIGVIAILLIAQGQRRQERFTPEPDAPATLMMLAIPDVPLIEAERRLAENPTDPLAYLTLGRAQLEISQIEQAEATLAEGLQYAEDRVVYLVNAGSAAADLERTTSAMFAFGAALNAARDTDQAATVRAFAGERLYPLVSRPRSLTAFQVRNLQSLRENRAEYREPLIGAMLARALLSNRLDGLTQALLGTVLVEDPLLAEAVLIQGELALFRGETAAARAAFDSLQANPDAPSWTRSRARELLEGLE